MEAQKEGYKKTKILCLAGYWIRKRSDIRYNPLVFVTYRAWIFLPSLFVSYFWLISFCIIFPTLLTAFNMLNSHKMLNQSFEYMMPHLFLFVSKGMNEKFIDPPNESFLCIRGINSREVKLVFLPGGMNICKSAER